MSNASPCQILRRSVKPLFRYGDFSIFQDGGRLYLGFSKCRHFRVGRFKRVQMCHHAKFHGDRSNRCRDMAVYHFSKMAAVRHLGFMMRVFGHPRKALGGLYRCANFGLNRRCSFEDMCVSILYQFGLKMPLHAPFVGVFEVKK